MAKVQLVLAGTCNIIMELKQFDADGPVQPATVTDVRLNSWFPADGASAVALQDPVCAAR